ncbi:MAG: hypothetical protein Altm1KO_19080 [Alteromonas macleodii]
MKQDLWKKALRTEYSARENIVKRIQPSLVLAALLATGITASAAAQELSIPCDDLEEKALAESKADEVERISAFTPATPLKRIDPNYHLKPLEKAEKVGLG